MTSSLVFALVQISAFNKGRNVNTYGEMEPIRLKQYERTFMSFKVLERLSVFQKV